MSRDSETVVFTGLPKGEGKDNGVEHIFQETVAETSQNRWDINLQIQEAQQTQSIHSKKIRSRKYHNWTCKNQRLKKRKTLKMADKK